jgi:hypothetical protein
MNFVEIGHCPDGWLKVRILAATEIYFEVNTQPSGHHEMLEKVCLIAPKMVRLDGDMMESFDNGGRTKINRVDASVIQKFSEVFEFRNVQCALPGFDKLR